MTFPISYIHIIYISKELFSSDYLVDNWMMLYFCRPRKSCGTTIQSICGQPNNLKIG